MHPRLIVGSFAVLLLILGFSAPAHAASPSIDASSLFATSSSPILTGSTGGLGCGPFGINLMLRQNNNTLFASTPRCTNGAWSWQPTPYLANGSYDVWVRNVQDTVVTGKLTVSAGTQPTVTIDQSSLTATSSMPVLSGTVSNIGNLNLYINDTNGTNGPVSIANGRWSWKVNFPLKDGSYKVTLGFGPSIFATGTLYVNTAAPPPVAAINQGSLTIATWANNPAITGTAQNIPGGSIHLTVQDAGSGIVTDSGPVTVANGAWSWNVPLRLSNGASPVKVYYGTQLLASGQLMISITPHATVDTATLFSSTGTPTITGTVTDLVSALLRVSLLKDGELKADKVMSIVPLAKTPWSWSVTGLDGQPLPNGSYTVRIQSGNDVIATPAYVLVVNNPAAVLPTGTISPLSVNTTGTPTITGTATNMNGKNLTVSITKGTAGATASVPVTNGAWSWKVVYPVVTLVPNGTYSVQAYAGSQLLATSTLSVAVPAALQPTVTITSPSIATSTTPTISGTAQNISPISVNLAKLDGTAVANASVTVVRNAWAWIAPALNPGQYNFKVFGGDTTPLASTTITVSLAATPSATIDASALSVAMNGSAQTSVPLSGTAANLGSVYVLVTRGSNVFEDSYSPSVINKRWTFVTNTSHVPAGTHTVRVYVSSASGGSTLLTTATLSVTSGSSVPVTVPPPIQPPPPVTIPTQSNPNCSMAAIPWNITPGSSSTLSWNVGNATTIAIDQGIGAVRSSGSRTITPTDTTTYTLTASGLGSPVTCSSTVTVAAAVNLGPASASIDGSSLSSGDSSRTISGSATNAPMLTVLVYPQTDTDTTTYRNNTVSASGGSWSFQLSSLAAGTYVVEIHTSTPSPSTKTLLTTGTFTVSGSSLSASAIAGLQQALNQLQASLRGLLR